MVALLHEKTTGNLKALTMICWYGFCLFVSSWENVFADKESGIAYYEWAVGSAPGHADIMPFSRSDSVTGISDSARPLDLQEGHSYYISVRVTSP